MYQQEYDETLPVSSKKQEKFIFFKNIGEPLTKFPSITSFQYNALLTLDIFGKVLGKSDASAITGYCR
mgnify:CR=1 FL=1